MNENKELLKKLNTDFKRVFPNESILDYIAIPEERSLSNLTVVYYRDGYYFIKYIGIREAEKSIKYYKNYSDFLYNILDEIITNKAIDFAAKNRKPNEDFRRSLFTKEIELMALISDEFREKKKNEIKAILENNPYTDS